MSYEPIPGQPQYATEEETLSVIRSVRPSIFLFLCPFITMLPALFLCNTSSFVIFYMKHNFKNGHKVTEPNF